MDFGLTTLVRAVRNRLRWRGRVGCLAYRLWLCFAHRMPTARRWHVGHLLEEYFEAHRIGPKCNPVTCTAQQWLVLVNDLIVQNLHATQEIVLGLQNRLRRIMFIQRLV